MLHREEKLRTIDLGGDWEQSQHRAKNAESEGVFHGVNGLDAVSREMGLERAAGIEPACLAWKARALPLSYARPFEGNERASPPLYQVFSGVSENYFGFLN